MSSLLQKVSFQDGSDLIEFYEALRDYVKWRNDPKVKSLFEQVDLIYGSSNDISSSLAFPRVPFGLRPAITDTSILKEKYWNYFLDANLTNTYPLSLYLTLLSTAYATKTSSSYSDSIIEETLQVLPAYFNALMKYNVKRVTEAGFPDISYVLQQKNRNLLDKLISVDEKLSKDMIDRRLYLTAFLLVVSPCLLSPLSFFFTHFFYSLRIINLMMRKSLKVRQILYIKSFNDFFCGEQSLKTLAVHLLSLQIN